MIGTFYNGMFLDFQNEEILCPECKHDHQDKSEEVTKKLNKNKGWITKINCICGTRFSVTVDMQGDFHTFKQPIMTTEEQAEAIVLINQNKK